MPRPRHRCGHEIHLAFLILAEGHDRLVRVADRPIGGAAFFPGFGLVHDTLPTNNDIMVIPGRVQNGVVILEGGSALPEGAAVSVTYPAPAASPSCTEKHRIRVPLVRTGEPGTVDLTGERIAEIMDEEDASSRH
jgi:hypothetical protein